jgi:hypothetical protein
MAASSVLRGSESLCKLLRYLADQFIEHPGESIKEYNIAVEVFGRSTHFDPRLDATVRVQTGRLRSKLAEYYAVEGAEDPVVLSIPRGSHSLTVRLRPPGDTVRPAGQTVPPVAAPAHPVPTPTVARSPLWVLSLTCLGLLAALVWVVVQRSTPQPSTAPAVVRNFWRGFIDRPEAPLVVFSNAEFVGRPETGMRYFNADKDSGNAIFDHYTGIGEVFAIHELDRVFNLLHHEIRVKRGRLLTLDDAENGDLIYVGSPSENLVLRDIPTTHDFVFRLAEDGPRKGDLEIMNLKPRPGEQKSYMGSKSLPIDEDYALIALIPGRNTDRWVMILAGTTTIGTQAAVETVCRERDVEALVSKIGVSPTSGAASFEAVLHVQVKSGVPLAREVVTLHRRGEP